MASSGGEAILEGPASPSSTASAVEWHQSLPNLKSPVVFFDIPLGPSPLAASRWSSCALPPRPASGSVAFDTISITLDAAPPGLPTNEAQGGGGKEMVELGEVEGEVDVALGAVEMGEAVGHIEDGLVAHACGLDLGELHALCL